MKDGSKVLMIGGMGSMSRWDIIQVTVATLCIRISGGHLSFESTSGITVQKSK